MEANKLIDIVENVNGATFVGLDTITKPVLAGGKANTMQGRVHKHMVGASVMVFQNKKINGYEAMVQRRLESEGKDPASFELGPRAWGERMEGLPIVTHKDKCYLEVIFLKAGTVSYTLDGFPIEKEDIVGLKESVEGEQGGLDNKVIIRTFAAESIAALAINGQVIQ